jgi:HSP20 family molecular chaperone IbpA
MAMITRIDPFRELAGFFENFADVNGERGNGYPTFGTFAPAVDVYEDEHNLVIKVEAPGMNEEA